MAVPPLKVYTHIPVTNSIICRSIAADAETSETSEKPRTTPKPSPAKQKETPVTPQKKTAATDDDEDDKAGICCMCACVSRSSNAARMLVRSMRHSRSLEPRIFSQQAADEIDEEEADENEDEGIDDDDIKELDRLSKASKTEGPKKRKPANSGSAKKKVPLQHGFNMCKLRSCVIAYCTSSRSHPLCIQPQLRSRQARK
jgi:hypothetical protein